MKLDASLARNTAAWAISCGWPEPLQQVLRPRCPPRGVHVAEALYQALGFNRARRQRVHADILRRVIGRHSLG